MPFDWPCGACRWRIWRCTSQQWQKKKLYQSQKLHQLQRVSVIYKLVLFTLWLLITIEEFLSVICGSKH